MADTDYHYMRFAGELEEKIGNGRYRAVEKLIPPSLTDRKIVRHLKYAVNKMATLLQQATANPNMIVFETALPSVLAQLK